MRLDRCFVADDSREVLFEAPDGTAGLFQQIVKR